MKRQAPGFPNLGNFGFGDFQQQPQSSVFGGQNGPMDQQQFNPFVAFHPQNLFNQALNALHNQNSFYNNPNQQQIQQPGSTMQHVPIDKPSVTSNQTPSQPNASNLNPSLPNKAESPSNTQELTQTEQENLDSIFNHSTQ